MAAGDINRMSLGIEQLSCVSLDDAKSGSTRRSLQSKQSKKEMILRKKLRLYKSSWRTRELAQPKATRRTEKYGKPPDVYESPVKPGVLNLKECPSRSDHLAKAKLIRLKDNKKLFRELGKELAEKLDKRIDESWNCMYYFYQRCEKAFKLHKQMFRAKFKAGGKKKKKEKSKADIWKELDEWLETRALAKPEPAPCPLPPRKRAPLAKLMERVDQLAIAKTPPPEYRPPRELPLAVSPAAMTYTITDMILKLSKFPKRILDLANDPGPRIPGKVEPGALRGQMTPRLEDLAKPHIKMAAENKDEKEDIGAISPNALKYKATARIKELAKPIER